MGLVSTFDISLIPNFVNCSPYHSKPDFLNHKHSHTEQFGFESTLVLIPPARLNDSYAAQ